MDALRSVWTEVLPTEVFDAAFLDDRLQTQYQSEQKLSQIVGIFSALAIFVACLGLFGLATYTAQQRTKEIGIRKAVGASVPSIVGLLSADFLKLVAVAVVVGTPLAYLAVRQWLADFAYRVELGPTPFALAAGAAFVLAALTVSYHALRAAQLNPATTLRDE
jgi:putative ABC transport system permease protein